MPKSCMIELPSRLKCGEIYTWECTGEECERFAIECVLCYDRPVCKLTEFVEHMEIWHGNDSGTYSTNATTTTTSNLSNTIVVNPILKSVDFDTWLNTPPMMMDLENSEYFIMSSDENKMLSNALYPFEDVLINGNDSDNISEKTLTSTEQQSINKNNSSYQEWLVTTESNNNINPDLTKLDIKSQIQFGLNETPLSQIKLTSIQIERLIELYKSHPRLWNPNDIEYNERDLARQSWQAITFQWNQYCGRNFSAKSINVRIGTLCKRFRKQCENILENGRANDKITFKYFQKMEFLNVQQPFSTRRSVFETQNVILLDVYKMYPELWHTDQGHNLKSMKKRRNAFERMSNQLATLHCIKLSVKIIEHRIKRLRKCYRLIRIRQLQSNYRPGYNDKHFKYFNQMSFLDEHVEPFLCRICYGLFQTMKIYSQHKLNCHHPSNESTMMSVFSDSQNGQTQTTLNFTVKLNAFEPELDSASEFIELPSVPLVPSEKQDLVNSLQDYNKMLQKNLTESDRGLEASTEITFGKEVPVRLTIEQTRKLIALYKQFPQLWHPEHPEYSSRKSRHIAWCALTSQMNRKYDFNYTWCTMHRKITDYTKYFKRERERVETQESYSKWFFYNDFAFVNHVLKSGNSKHRSLMYKKNNIKIIQMYKKYPQLWNTQHPDYSKRKKRQQHFELMRQRLLEEMCMDISIDKLKQRIIEFRYNYRNQKQKRLQGDAGPIPFYEFQNDLKFLEDHISPFDCEHCRGTFKNLSDFMEHKRKVHSYSPPKHDKTDKELQQSNSSFDNICHICGIKLTTRGNLVYHLKRHLDQRSHECSMCPKAFFNSTALRVHERSHTKDQPYMCEICGRSYVNASKLNQHRKRHSNQRDYSCIECKKSFYTAFELERHTRRHLNIRDKVCSICGRAFFVGSSYYAHMRIHSDTKQYSCDICGKSFAQYPGLYKHRKRFHPC